MANNKINYDINFNVDMSSLELLKEALNNIQTMSSQYYIKINGGKVAENQLRELKQTASQVEIAMDAAFNPKLNTMNFTQFNSVLKASGLNIQKIEQQFNTAGDSGKRAFRNLTEQIFTANTELKKTKGFIQNISDTLFNAAKWSIAYGVINNITNGIKSAWTYAISLDSALNDIRIVTGKSYEEMEKFAKSANKAAKALGTSTMDYTKGSLIYYQQGLGQRDVEARTAVSAKTANVTGQSMQEVSEELTAVWNGFQVTAKDAESYVDRLAAVAAASASDLEELSTAMSKVASSANAMGINVDQLTAQIATIESVTRQDAASIGTALKTIYSRMGDLAIGAEDEFGVVLGDVSGKMKKMGIDILDQEGNMRDMGIVIEEVAAKWGTWTEAQQQAAAVALAGKRQYNNLIALFENWDMYESNKSTSQNSLGELQKQQDTYMESTKAHMQQMQAAAEGLKDALFNNKSMNAFFDVMRFGLEQLTSLVNGLGGAGNILFGVFSSLGVLWSEKIGRGIGGALASLKSIDSISINQQARAEVIAQYTNAQEDAIQKMVSLEEDKLKYANILTDQEKERYDLMIKQTNELATQKELTDSMIKRAGSNISGNAKNVLTEGLSAPIKNSKGQYSSLNAETLANMSEGDRTIIQKNVAKERESLILRQEKFNNLDLNKISYAGKKDATPTQKGSATKSINKIQQLAQQQLDTGLNKTSKNYKELTSALDILNSTIDENGKLTSANKETREAALEVAKLLAKAQTEEAGALDNVDRAISEGLPKYKALTEAEKALLEEQKKLADRKRTEQRIANITSIIFAMGQFTTAIMSAINLTEVLMDKNVDWREKIKQTVMVILSLAPMIISVAKVLHDQLVAQAAKTNAEVTLSLGWIGLILTGITVLVSLISTVLSFVDTRTELEKVTDEFNQQIEVLNEMQETLKNTKNAYQDLLDTIDKYQNTRDSIDDLKAGTEEWSEAIINANEQALNLINTYSFLADSKYHYIDKETGLINISNEGLEEVKKQQKDQIQKQQANLYAQQALVKEKNNNLTQSNFVDKVSPDKNSAADLWGNIGSGAFTVGGTGAIIGTAIAPGIGTIIGGITGLIGGALLSAAATDLQDAITEIKIEKNNEIYSSMVEGYTNDAAYFDKDEFNNQFIEMTDGLKKTDEELAELKQTLIDDIQTTVANTKAADSLRQEYAKNILLAENNKNYENAKDQDAVAAAFASKMDKVQDAYDKDASDKDLRNNEEFKKDLAGSLGISENQITGIKDGKIEYIEGNETKYIDTATAISQANTYNAKETAEKDLKSIIDLTDKIASDSKTKAFTKLAGGKDSVSLFEFNLKELQNKEGLTELKKLVSTDDQAKLLGYESLEEFNNAADKSFKNSIKQYENAQNNINNLTSKNVSIRSDLSLDTIKKVEKGIENAYKVAGAEGANALTNLINSVDAEQGEVIADITSAIDWTDEGAIETFNEELKKAGINIDQNSIEYKIFIEQLEKSNNVLTKSINKFDDILSKIEQINDLTESLKIGSILSDEDYEKLISLYAGAEKFFIRVAGGYQMISGSSEEIRSNYLQRFSSLKNAKTYYAGLKATAENTKDLSFNSSATGNELTTEGQKILNLSQEDQGRILKYAGINVNEFKKAVEAGANRSTVQTKIIQDVLTATKNIQSDANNGKYNSDQIETSFYTKNGLGNFSSLDAVKKSSSFRRLTVEQQEKITKSWLANYANEYGTSVSVIEALAGDNKDYDKALKSLQLLNDYQNIISNIQNQSKNLKGESLALALEDQNTILDQTEDTYKNIIDSKKESLGIQTQENSYLALYSEYLSKVDNLSDEQKTEWKEVLDAAKEAENVSSQMKENIVSALDAKLQVTLDENQVKADWADFKKNYMKTDKNGNIVFKSIIEMNQQDTDFEARLAAIQKKTDLFIDSFNATSKTIADFEKEGSDEALQKAQELRQKQKSQIEEQISNLNNLYTLWTDGWDAVIALSDNYAEKLEQINNLYSKLISLNNALNKTFGNNNDFYQKQIGNQENIIIARKQTLESTLKEYENAKALGITGDVLNEYYQKASSAAEAFAQANLSLLDLIKEKAKDGIEDIFKELAQASEEWDKTKTLDDRLLNIVDSNLNRSQLRRKFQEAIDNADSLAAQQKIQKVMEEQLSILEEKDRLSQYEVDRANAVYELTLKQIALEESQRNASKMKLVRDTNGNLTYSFVQDEDAAAKAQEDLKQTQANLFNIDNEQAKNQVDKYYQYISEWESKLQQAREEGWNEEQIAKLNDYYIGENGLLTNIKEEFSEILDNLTQSGGENGILSQALEVYKKIEELYNTDLNDILNKVNQNQEDYVKNWTAAAAIVSDSVTKIENIATKLNTGLSGLPDLNTQIAQLRDQLDVSKEGSIGNVLKTLNNSLSGYQDKTKSDLSSIITTFTNNITNFVKSMENYKEAIGNYTSQLKGESNNPGAIGSTSIMSGDRVHGGPRKDTTFAQLYDTGGYTGEWDSSGKLAVLHQKELVLNADDTANMLAAVQIVRTLDEALGGIGLVLAAQSVAPAIKPSLGKLNNQNDVVDQNVRIEANFPNVTDRYEIQEAINNLVNLASQKAFENNKY